MVVNFRFHDTNAFSLASVSYSSGILLVFIYYAPHTYELGLVVSNDLYHSQVVTIPFSHTHTH